MAERKQFLLRIDQGLWADLEAWAADELRSVNGQVEYVLREAVRKRKGASCRPAVSPEPPEKPQSAETAEKPRSAVDEARPARTGKKGPQR